MAQVDVAAGCANDPSWFQIIVSNTGGMCRVRVFLAQTSPLLRDIMDVFCPWSKKGTRPDIMTSTSTSTNSDYGYPALRASQNDYALRGTVWFQTCSAPPVLESPANGQRWEVWQGGARKGGPRVAARSASYAFLRGICEQMWPEKYCTVLYSTKIQHDACTVLLLYVL